MKAAGLIAAGLLSAAAVAYGALAVCLILRVRPVPITGLPPSTFSTARSGRASAQRESHLEEPIAA